MIYSKLYFVYIYIFFIMLLLYCCCYKSQIKFVWKIYQLWLLDGVPNELWQLRYELCRMLLYEFVWYVVICKSREFQIGGCWRSGRPWNSVKEHLVQWDSSLSIPNDGWSLLIFLVLSIWAQEISTKSCTKDFDQK